LFIQEGLWRGIDAIALTLPGSQRVS
jgi:hypothetical protein